MHRILLRYSAVFALLLALADATESFAASPKRVLFISSYHPAFPSFDRQLRGIRQGFAESGVDGKAVTIDVEFMDTKRFPKDEQVPKFRRSLSEKLIRLPAYDVVIVGDDNALVFALSEQNGLFAKIPIIFLAVNNVARALEQNGNPRVTGVIEHVDADDTRLLIGRLYPKAKIVRVIVDGTPSGIANRKQMTNAATSGEGPEIEFLSLADLSYAELFAQLTALPDDAPVLVRNVYVDRLGEATDYAEVVAEIRKAFTGPLFAVQSHGIGHGILGGRMISHVEQGRTAGIMAAKVLAGTSVTDLPVSAESPNLFVFDWNEVVRLGIDPDALPEGAEFHNRTPSILESYPEWVVGSILFVIVQTAIIALLISAVIARRRAERLQREAAYAAEYANRAKTEFLANMSHELRTPLNAVIGFSEFMMLSDDDRIDRQKRQEYLAAIADGGRHLLEMINGILDISRIEMGHDSLNEEPVEVRGLLHSCAVLIEERAASAEIQFDSVLPAGNPVLNADPTKTRQMVINLLSNAIKFTPAGGKVTLSAVLEPNGGLAISVADTGVGILPTELESVTEPFYRGTRRETLVKEGTGLGLAIVKRFALLHDAWLNIQSEIGRGTRVSLRFPASRVSGTAFASEQSAA